MNKVLLTGRLTRDPEMRSLASGKSVTTFTVASNEFIGGGREKAEYHPVVTWDRLAEIAGTYLGKGQQVAVEGRLQTRSWDDDRGQRHWKTEIVASHVEMLSGRRKKDYEAQQAADSLAAQAEAVKAVARQRALDFPPARIRFEHGAAIFSGWTMSPHGIRSVDLWFDNRTTRHRAKLVRDPLLDLRCAGTPGLTRTRYLATFDRRPAGVRRKTDVQVEVTDGRGETSVFDDRWITWE